MVYLENIKQMYRIVNDHCPALVKNSFPRLSHKYLTRGDNFGITKHKLQKYNVSFLVQCVIDWNKTNIDQKNQKTVKSFVRNVKSKLISKY